MDIFCFHLLSSVVWAILSQLSIPTLSFGWHQDPLFCIQSPATRDRENQFSDIRSKALTPCSYGKCISLDTAGVLFRGSPKQPPRGPNKKNHGSHTLELIEANIFASPGSYKFHPRATAVKRRQLPKHNQRRGDCRYRHRLDRRDPAHPLAVANIPTSRSVERRRYI